MTEAERIAQLQAAQKAIKQGQVNDGVRRVFQLLRDARREVVADVAETDWESYYLPRITAAVTKQLDQAARLVLDGLTMDQASFWNVAQSDAGDVLAAMGIEVSLPEIPTSLLQAMQTKGAQRIGGLFNFAKDMIDRTIAQSLLTGASREDTIAKIGNILELGVAGGAKPEGLFGSISARARFIYQQEVGMAYATAQDERRNQAAQYVPGLQKVWVHDGHPHLPRVDHVAMHGQVVDQDEDFENPITGETLGFPRDPSADISETAGCTCDVFMYRDEYGDVLEFIGPATGARMRRAA